MKKIWWFFAAVLIAAVCSGCASGAEELYSLPRLADQYVQLQELIDQRVDEGAEYAAPVGGSNRQSVQLRDLTGDGVPEALAFLADAERRPTICIYRQDFEGNYFLYIIINGEGSAVNRVEYADLTGDEVPEFLVSWQVGGDLQLLSAYDLSGTEPREVLNADCGIFTVCDPDDDGVSEIADLHVERGSGYVTLYDALGEAPVSADLSERITEVLRIRSGTLSDGTQALFVESSWNGDGLITDVLVVSANTLKNITMSSAGYSTTLRGAGAYAADINGDGALEIPESSGDILNWYALDAAGRKTLAASTYHDYDDGWYIDLTDRELSNLTVEKGQTEAGEPVTIVYRNKIPLFGIYTLTGENRMDRAAAEGRFSLASRDSTEYAGEVFSQSITQEELQDSFCLIYTEWQTGDI